MRRFVVFFLIVWSLPVRGLPVAGDPDAEKTVEKVISALGGEEGLKKRRSLYLEQTATQEIPGKKGNALKVTVAAWQKGEKRRMEQRVGSLPGAATVMIYDGKTLSLLLNGSLRDPGLTIRKTFEAGKKREDLWWDCLKKPLKVKSLGRREIRKREIILLEFTHPDGDKTLVGVDPKTYLPVYMKYKALHPYTGKKVWWEQWQTDFRPMKEADDLLFPKKLEMLQEGRKVWTAETVKAKVLKEIPDSLFGEDRPVD